MNNIYLTGFMGAGKSTVGVELARQLGWVFLDMDSLLVAKHQKSIEMIFEEEGEPAFRAYEAALLAELCDRSQQVIALGGGAILLQKNQERILSSGFCVFLRSKVETLVERLFLDQRSGKNRPLLKSASHPDLLMRRVTELLNVRNPVYEKAHLIVDCDQKTVSDIAQEVTQAFCSSKLRGFDNFRELHEKNFNSTIG